MEIVSSKNIHDFKPIFEGLVPDFGYSYYHTILVWCGIINEISGHSKKGNKYWEVWLVKNDEDTVIGICGLFALLPNFTKELWLGWFGILPEHRNKGLGKDVLDWMKEKAKNAGAEKIFSYVDKSGTPLPFYFRNGFKRVCSVGEYLQQNPTVSSEDDFEDLADHVIVFEF